MRKIIVSLIALLIVAIPVLAQIPIGSVDAEADGIKNFWGVQSVKKGQKIQVDVTVKNTGTIDMDGFWITLNFKKPDGTYTDLIWFDLTGTVLKPGDTWSAGLKSDYVADQIGTWTAIVNLRANNEAKTTIAFDTATFEVVEELPKGTITITGLVGYGTLATIIGAGIYAIRRYFVG